MIISPIWLIVEIKIVIIDHSTCAVEFIQFIKIDKKIKDKKYPPIIPEYVLFGLILVNLGPLNNFPNT